VTDPDECGRKDHKHRIKQNSKTRDGSTASGCGFLSIVFFATEFCRREELLQLLCGFFVQSSVWRAVSSAEMPRQRRSKDQLR
jgi:hypothetical protein